MRICKPRQVATPFDLPPREEALELGEEGEAPMDIDSEVKVNSLAAANLPITVNLPTFNIIAPTPQASQESNTQPTAPPPTTPVPSLPPNTPPPPNPTPPSAPLPRRHTQNPSPAQATLPLLSSTVLQPSASVTPSCRGNFGHANLSPSLPILGITTAPPLGHLVHENNAGKCRRWEWQAWCHAGFCCFFCLLLSVYIDF